jgi:hypothetical protein
MRMDIFGDLPRRGAPPDKNQNEQSEQGNGDRRPTPPTQ